MLRSLRFVSLLPANRSIAAIISIDRRGVRGGARPSIADETTPSTTTTADDVRFGYGVRAHRTEDRSEVGQRLASFYGHPRLPRALDEEEKEEKAAAAANDESMEKTKERSTAIIEETSEKSRLAPRSSKPVLDQLGFDRVEEDETTAMEERMTRDRPAPPSDQVGDFHPLTRPVPAARRKPREFLRTYTLAPLVNDSVLLRNLVDLGVDLSKWDALHNVADWLLKLDWNTQCRPVLAFLLDTTTIGLTAQTLGPYVTGNPWILQQSLDDLRRRVAYLESKKFSREAILRIVTKARHWLNFHVKTIDQRLGWLQREFALTGDQVRFVITHSPKLVTMGTGYIQMLQFSFKEEMGFSRNEMSELMVKDPRLFLTSKETLSNSFEYLHNSMGFTHADILTWPSILRAPRSYVRQRHEYLRSLGRDQFDATKPNYVSLCALGKFNDQHFAENCAKTTIGEYNQFLKKF